MAPRSHIAAFLLALGVLAPTAAAEPHPWVIAADDATVRSASPSTPLGAGSDLRTGRANAPAGVQRSFLKFRLPNGPWQGEIVSATLRGTFVSGARVLHDLHFVANDGWSEDTLTWDTQPAVAEPPVGSVAPGPRENPFSDYPYTVVTWDVTDLARQERAGDGLLSLRVAASDEAPLAESRWGSREGSHTGFQLELVFELPQTLASDDLLLLGTEGRRTLRVFALDPETRLAKPLAAFGTADALTSPAVDPRDGSIVALGRPGEYYSGGEDSVVRLDPASGALEEIATDQEGWIGGSTDAVEVAPDGKIYVLSVNGRVYRFEADGGRSLVTEGGLLGWPQGIALEADGQILVVDDFSGLIRIDPATGAQSIVVEASQFGYPRGMTFDESGALWVVNGNWNDGTGLIEGELLQINAATGEVVRIPLSTPYPPNCIAAEAAGALLIGLCIVDQPGPGGVWRFDPATGQTETVVDDPLSGLVGLATDPAGGIYATMIRDGASRILRIDEHGVRVAAAPLHTNAGQPHVLLDEQRRILFGAVDRVHRLDPVSGTQELLSLDPGSSLDERRILGPLALSPSGRLLAITSGYQQPNSLVEIDRETGARQVVVPELPSGSWLLAAEPSGTWLVGRTRYSPAPVEGSILRLDLDAGTETVVSAGGLLGEMKALSVDRAGGIHAVDRTGRVVRVDPETGAQELVASIGTTNFARLAVDRAGRPIVQGGDSPSSPHRRLAADGTMVTLTGPGDPHDQLALVVALPACADGFDNDGDGLVDAGDPQCTAPESHREHACGLGWEIPGLLGLLARRRKRRLSPSP